MENLLLIYIFAGIIALVIQWFIIYTAVKSALSETLKTSSQNFFQNTNIRNQQNVKTEENSEYTKSENYVQYHISEGLIEIEPAVNRKGKQVFLNGKIAPDGKYNLGFMDSVTVKNGVVI